MPAFAQDLAQGSAPPAAEQTAPGVTGVEDILVTATKRNENLIDVPISMSVLTETAITSAGIDSASEFLSNIPNVPFIVSSEEGRLGNECVSTCRYRWWQLS